MGYGENALMIGQRKKRLLPVLKSSTQASSTSTQLLKL